MTERQISARWVFTLNNYTSDEVTILKTSFEADAVQYATFGYETAGTGTPHLQGFIIFKVNQRFNAVRLFIGERAYICRARGSDEQAAAYCHKEGDFYETGTIPVKQQGKRSDWDDFKQWIQAQTEYPTELTIATEFTNLYARYRASCLRFVSLFYVPPAREIGHPNGWQRELESQLDLDAGDRSITFVVDEAGKTGKSWFIRYFMSKHPKQCQRLSVGKRDDLAHAFDTSVRYLFLDIPRTQLEFLQYSFLESVKDRMIFSPKYDSCCKLLTHDVHVVVFTNEEPDYNKLTNDRYNIFRPFNDTNA